ncbi:MAG: hypothetical protein LC659_01145 [Myxococcales bacterium]|nr:hypothetical protein [Myxococcales bacterium]
MSPAESIGEHGEALHHLQGLAAELRVAIRESLMRGSPQFAVVLDTARDFVESVLAEAAPTSTRIGVARARAEIALEVWREAHETRH